MNANDHLRTLIIGGSESGKSTWIINFLINPEQLDVKPFKKIYIFTTEGRKNGSAFNRIRNAEYHTYSDEELGKVFDSHNIRERGVIVMDDPAGMRSRFMSNNQNFENIFAGGGRHRNLSLILACQKLTLYPPLVRLNAKEIIMFDLGNYAQVQSFCRDFLPIDAPIFRRFYGAYFDKKYKTLVMQKDGANWKFYDGQSGELIVLK